MGFGLAIIVFVREPVRSNYSFVSKETFNQPKRGYFKTTYQGARAIFKIGCIRWNLLGVGLRSWGMSAATFYSLKYFNLYGQPTLFSLVNAAVLLFGGIFANMNVGFICDKFGKTNPNIRPQILVTLSLLCALFSFLIYFFQISFWFAVTFHILEVALTGGFFAPSMSMMQQIVPPSYKGTLVGFSIAITSFTGLLCQVVIVEQFGTN